MSFEDFAVAAPKRAPLHSIDAPYASPCKLAWSPDGAYLSFVTRCDVEGYDDLFVWDINNGLLKQLTDIESELNHMEIGRGQALFVSSHHTGLWYDAHTILVASNGQLAYIDPNTEDKFRQIAAYHLPDGKLEHILGGDLLDQWLLNPASSEIVYQTIDDGFNSGGVQPRLWIMKYDGHTLQYVRSLAPGCNFSWSPDGATLVYSEQDYSRATNCFGEEYSNLTFMDQATGQVTHFQPKDEVVGLGWIHLQRID